MNEIRRPTTKPKTKMKSVAEIHGATNAWIGTRISLDHSRRIIVHRPIQLTSFIPGAGREGEGREAVEEVALMPPRGRIQHRSRVSMPLRGLRLRAPALLLTRA